MAIVGRRLGVRGTRAAAMSEVIRILMLEDEPEAAEGNEQALRKAGLVFHTLRVATRQAFLDALETFRPDLVLADFKLPDFDGGEALRLLRERGSEAPFILVTGALDDEAAAEQIQAGAADFVLKDRLARLGPAVRMALAARAEARRCQVAEAAARASEARYRGLFESNRDGIVQIDLQGRFTEFNQAYLDLLGYTREELLGRHYTEITAPQWLAMNAEILEKQIPRRGYSDEYEKEYIHKDGSLVPVSVRAFAVRSDSGAMLGTWATVRDIRERRQAERALRESEVWFRSLIEGPSDVVVVVGADKKVRYISPAVRAVGGYEPAELVGSELRSLVHPEDLASVERSLAELLEHPETTTKTEARYRNKAGGWRNTEAMSRNLLSVPAVAGIVVNLRDVTERKQAEAALRESDRRFSVLLETVQLAAVMLDVESRLTYCNDYFLKLVGETREAVLGKNWFAQFVPPAGAGELSGVFSGLLADKAEALHHENEVLTHSGERRLIRWNNSVLRSASGEVIGTASIGEDITERKRANEALRASQQLIEGILNAIPVRVFWKDRQLVYLGGNAVFARDAGLSGPKELIGKNDYQLGWREQAELYRADDLEVINSGKAKIFIEEPQTTPDGKRITLLTSKLPLLDASGAVAGVLGTYADITELKSSQQNLKLFRELIDQSADAIEVVDPLSLRFLDVNKTGCRELGYSREELLSMTVPDIDPAFTAAAQAKMELALAKSELVVMESTHRRKDGSSFPVEFSVKRVELDRLYNVVAVRDISARKAMEARLQLANLLVEQSPTVLFRWAAKPGWPVDYVSQNVRQWGYEPDELLSGNRAYSELIHPDDLPQIAKEVAAHLDSGAKQYAQVYRIRSKAGAVIWVDDRTTVERDAQGQPVFFQGVVLDITESKLDEERRKARLLRVQAQLLALGEIIHSAALAAGDVEALAREITERVARVAGVERASVWLFDVGESELRCIDLYQASPALHSAGLVLNEREYRNEFQALKESSFVAADQPLSDTRTRGYVESYIKPLGITAMLDVAVQVATKNVGLLCLEHVGPEHHWQADEIAFARQMADQIGFALAKAQQLEAEHRLRRVNRTLKSLSACNSAVVHAVSEAQLLQRMCEVAVDPGGYQMAWVGYAEQDAARTIRPVARAGDGADYVQAAKISWADDEAGRGPAGLSIRTGEVQVIRDIAKAPSMRPWRQAAKVHGYRSVVALPLKGPAGNFGTLVIYSGELDAFGVEELALLTEVAGDLAYGITALRTQISNEQGLQRLERSMEATVEALASTVEMRDPYTSGHQKRVANLAVAMARVMGLSAARIQGLDLAASIHDIGKIRVPAELLNKPGALSDIEFRLIQAHAQTGYEILKDVSFPWPIADMVRQHHERLDGSGYPQGLKAEQILQESKILAVADVVEAMSSHRPDRPARGIEPALEYILQQRGTTLDAESVDACVALFREQGYQMPVWKTD
jgi:PAS domain S-box-containing protein/putative nucleotidyltransferase with HDIG domain